MANRFLNLTDGTAMIVTDLHGDREAFDLCLEHFNTLRRAGQVQRLIFLGDVIHGSGPAESDASLSMICDIMSLRNELGPDVVMMLLGNHEMSHIYGVTLAKGDREFTPRFEHALGRKRDTILAFFRELPFYFCTAAGVLLGHAGPSPEALGHIPALRNFDHDALLAEADAVLAQAEDLTPFYRQFEQVYGDSYPELAWHYLAVRGPDDPRYPHLLRGFMIGQQNPAFEKLWIALFTVNERGLMPPVYENVCQAFLAACSDGAPVEQRVMVSGHIPTNGGHAVLNDYHLRLSSAAHAHPRTAGQYLLLDCAKPVQSAKKLIPFLRTVFARPRPA